jgi:TolB-like protein/class 3 adenylate cyclase
MAAEVKKKIALEIAHVLFIDVVAYSKMASDDQRAAIEALNRIVQSTDEFRKAESQTQLLKLATGDGMALIFYHSPEDPVECALEISRALKEQDSKLRLRMGVHSGPVSGVVDVNGRANVAGAGINTAQRVMDCGDAGHILLSKRVAEDLEQFKHWRPHLYHLGECEVKHGEKIEIVNLFTAELGNAERPKRLATPSQTTDTTSAPTRRARPRSLIWIMAISIAALLAGSFLFWQRHQPKISATAAAIPEKSIAVLPFENLSTDKENAFFADGVQDEILTHLAKVADLKVISRTSVLPYKSGPTRNLRQIAQELGVAYVLEGSVQRAGDRVRVSAQLLDARKDTHLWADHYDRPLVDVFAIQTEVAEAIADQLQAKLSADEKAAIEQRPTTDLAAYDLYVRAKALSDLGGTPAFSAQVRENQLQAVQLLEQAITRDKAFFLPYYQLADINDRLYFYGSDHTSARLALANSAVETAIRLRPNSGEAHLALGRHLYMGYRDYTRARAELATARKLLPNEPWAIAMTGFIDRRQGRWEEHIQNLQRALELDPRNLFLLQEFSVSYYVLRRYNEMAAVLDRAVALAPGDAIVRVGRASVDFESRADPKPMRETIGLITTENPAAAASIANQWLNLALCERDWAEARRALANISSHGISTENTWFPRSWFEGITARAEGNSATANAAFTAARVEVEKLVREQPNYGEALSLLGMIDAALGLKEDAIREGQRAVELLPVAKDAMNGVNVMRSLALIYTWVGEKDRAIEQLNAVVKLPGYLSYARLKLHPEWDSLRGDPRFEKIVNSLAPR